MTENNEKLLNVLRDETTLYSELYNLSVQKTDVVINNKIKELDIIVEKEKYLIVRIGKLEQQRQETLISISDELNLNVDSLNANTILKDSSPSDRKQFSKVVDELTATLEKLNTVNDRNKKLIESNLVYINEVIDGVVMGDSKNNTYNDSGNRQVKQKRNIIDQSV